MKTIARLIILFVVLSLTFSFSIGLFSIVFNDMISIILAALITIIGLSILSKALGLTR